MGRHRDGATTGNVKKIRRRLATRAGRVALGVGTWVAAATNAPARPAGPNHES
jgi:hypothetical protein